MIAGIEGRQQMIWADWIAHNLVEIHDCIEMSRCPDPGIDCLPVGFVERRRMVGRKAHKRTDGYTHHLDAVRMGPQNDLFVSTDDPFHQGFMLCLGDLVIGGQCAQIVDSLEYDEIAHACLHDYVAIEARQGWWPIAV